MKKLTIARRLSQIFFFLVFVYILWSTTYPLKGILPTETFLKTDPLVMIFTSISERVILPWLGLAFIIPVLSIVFGRFFCGWMCPLGGAIDCCGALTKKKFIPGEGSNKKIRKIKFLILGVIAAFSFVGIQVAWIFDPLVIMARFISLNFIPAVTFLLNSIFIFLIQKMGLYGFLHDFYRSLKMSLLGVKVHFFASSGIIFLFFLVVMATTFFIARLWCRSICPLGAIYASLGRFAFLRRNVKKCVNCGTCVKICRTGAISDGINYEKGECILCMDCVYCCPVNGVEFVFSRKQKAESRKQKIESGGLSRKNFIFLMVASIFSLGFKWKNDKDPKKAVIRPPGSLREIEFADRCVRCGNCMKVCPTNGLQPVFMQAGLDSIWTPQLVPEVGYCEYNCNLCGTVCPTGAIPKLKLDLKKKTKIGVAKVDRFNCIAWEGKQNCIVCEEHCPVAEKAIKTVDEEHGGVIIKKPVVDPYLCIGCGICQNKCPVRPNRAIKVYPEGANRTSG